MQCGEFEDRLNAVLDERRHPACDAELRAHCATCSACRQTAINYGMLLNGLAGLAVPQPPADLTTRVMVELQHRVVARWRTGSLVAAAMATAAAVLISVVPLFRSDERPLAQPVASVQFTVTPFPFQRVQWRRFSLLSTILKLAQSDDPDPYAKLATNTGRNMANSVLALPWNGGQRSLQNDDFRAFPEEDSWATQIAESLRPVAESMSETFYLLWRMVPAADLPGRS